MPTTLEAQAEVTVAQRTRLLIVEHDLNVAKSLQDLLTKLGYDVPVVATSAEEALGHLEKLAPDLVLMGLGSEGENDGIEAAKRLNKGRRVPVVYVTDHDEEAYLERARATQPYGYLLKPYSERGMHATIQVALARRQAEAALEASEQRFRESERRFASMLHNVKLISVMLDRDANVTYCNDYLLRLCGWTADEVIGRNWFEVFVPPEDQGTRVGFEDLLNDLPSAWHHENEIFTKAGERRLVHWSNSLLRGPGGDVIGAASLGEDITERTGAEIEIRRLNADLERRVAERTAELETANRNLEAYDQMVSHDLRAPARHILGFASVLLEECAPQLDANARAYITRIVAATVRMDELVTDLFDLSTAKHGPVTRNDLNLAAIARVVFDSLNKGGRKVELIAAAGVVVHADGSLIQLLLEHLLGNAVKFTARREMAVIEVGTLKQGDDTPVYFVRDNGAGFEMSEVERLFEPFERAHRQSEFAGTGLGLPTVKRIVARHGGRVWAEAQPNVGATFYFTLGPAEPAAPEPAPNPGATQTTPA
jgi:PAS domain S-box-containing protein